MGTSLSSFYNSSIGEQAVKITGLKLSSFYNPSIRDQAVKKGYFAVISPSDLKENPVFTEYNIHFKTINPQDIVFEGPTMDSPPYTNEQFNNKVCEISFSGKCRFVKVNDNGYDLVDASCDEYKKLIHITVHEDISRKSETNRYHLYYYIYKQPTSESFTS